MKPGLGQIFSGPDLALKYRSNVPVEPAPVVPVFAVKFSDEADSEQGGAIGMCSQEELDNCRGKLIESIEGGIVGS